MSKAKLEPSNLEQMVKAALDAEKARQEAKERDERSRSHVRAGTTVGGRRINDRRGNPGKALCGGELTSYDTTLPEARKMAKDGSLAKWVGCAACRELVDPTPAPVAFGMKMARAMFAKRGNHTEMHLSEAEVAAMLALAFEEGSKKR